MGHCIEENTNKTGIHHNDTVCFDCLRIQSGAEKNLSFLRPHERVLVRLMSY